MALFGRKNKTVDFTNRMVRQQERISNIRENMKQAKAPEAQSLPTPNTNSFSAGNSFGFLDNASSYSQPSYAAQSDNSPDDAEERKRKLAKRLADITNQLEEISNQIYHLQQRVEVLEKKANISGFGY